MCQMLHQGQQLLRKFKDEIHIIQQEFSNLAHMPVNQNPQQFQVSKYTHQYQLTLLWNKVSTYYQ